MFIQFLMAMIAIYGIHFFGPLLFGMFSLLLPLAGVAGFLFWRKQRKKIQKEQSEEQKTVFDFSHALSQKKTFWKKTKSEHANVYTSQYYNWRIKIQEHTNYQTAHIFENGRLVASATYHPAFNSLTNVNHFLMCYSNDETGRDAIASIWNLFIDQSFTNQTVDSLDEESSFHYMWERVRTLRDASAEESMREFQEAYAELYRYEFRMDEGDKQLWKHGLYLAKQIAELSNPSQLQKTLQYITRDLQLLQTALEKRHTPKTESKQKTGNEWYEMDCVVETWNEGDQIAYLEYKSLYGKLISSDHVSEEVIRELQAGKENVYNRIHNPSDALPLLRKEMKRMNEIRDHIHIVLLENE